MMTNQNRYYKTPFAESGNKTDIPDVSVGGAVAFDTGYGPDYELPQGQPSRKRIERDKYNGLHHSITKNLKQWQENVYPTWIEDDGTGVAFAYPQGMIVSHAGFNWVSNEAANIEEPGVGLKWSKHVEDYDAFTAALLAEAGIVDDGLPDTAGGSQRVDAINSLIRSGVGFVTPKAWGILADGSDETAKWQALITHCATNRLAIGPFVGDTLITSQLLLPAGFGGIFGMSQLYTVFKKGFNGDLFSANSQSCVLSNFWIQGDGSNFTGGGVYVVSDNINLAHVRITDTEDSGIICQGGEAVFLNVSECHITPTNTSTAAIRGDGDDVSNAPTVRDFSKISGAFTLDLSGMNQVVVSDSLFSSLITSATTGKMVLRGNRITAAANDIDILGVDHIITGNNWSHGSAFGTTIFGSNIIWEANNYIVGTNSKASPSLSAAFGGPMTNRIVSNLINFSSDVEWKGVTTDGSFGDSNVKAYFRLNGAECYFTFNLIKGSTAVLPTGAWSITVPFKALVSARFSVLVKSSSGTFYSAVGQMQGGGNQIFMYLNGVDDAVSESSLLFGTNAQLEISGSYLMATV